MPVGKSQKIVQFINYRMRVTLNDSRTIIGTFMAYDKHMNLVLGEAEEFRTIKGKKGGSDRDEKRPLGFIILRGESIVALSVEGPPPVQDKRGAPVSGPGPGIGRAAGRGVPTAPLSAPPIGLSGPMPGVGGPAPHSMNPGRGQMTGMPESYGMGMPPRGPPGMPPPGMGMMPPGFPPGMMPPGMPPMSRPGMPPPGMPPPGARPPGMPGMMPPGMPPGGPR
eukprot:m.333111 g.333111  ORF g.333111 m.333111 type:complete len:222 (+) comp17071_c0_seq1:132-797(+)